MSQPGWSWPGIGNDKVTEFLECAYSSGQVAQAYIFVGLDDLGKSTVALAFARNLQGQPEGFNSDLHILEPEAGKKSISIEATREFIKTLNLSSFLNSYKIGIIKEAELLSEEAKSALLKTLEEPKDKVVIILLVSDESRLPATILSRSQLVYFYPVPAALIYDYLIDNYGANRSLAKDLANLALGRPLLALKLLEHPEEYKE
jgi:DNA polymerase-3 subunit delta'